MKKLIERLEQFVEDADVSAGKLRNSFVKASGGKGSPKKDWGGMSRVGAKQFDARFKGDAEEAKKILLKIGFKFEDSHAGYTKSGESDNTFHSFSFPDTKIEATVVETKGEDGVEVWFVGPKKEKPFRGAYYD